MPAKNDDLDFVIERVLEAPRELVYAAWTDPAHLAQWWGPFGYSTRAEVEARAGGKYNLVMRGADGSEYPMHCVLREVVPNERLVYGAAMHEHPDEWYRTIDPSGKLPRDAFDHVTTVTFEARGPRSTKLTIRARFSSQAARDALVKHGMQGGWNQSLEKLAEKVATDSPEREIVQVRLFDAPRALVWEALTDPRHLVQWWGPNGFTLTTVKHELRVGGTWQLVMHGPDGSDYPNKQVYTEIVPPERLSYRNAGGKAGGEGVSFEATITLVELDGKTRLTLRQRFTTEAERDFVERTFHAVEGGVQTLARLARHLAARE